jgi:hypothetical protein
LQSLEVVDEDQQVGRREYGHVGCRPCRLGPTRCRADQPLAESVGPDRRRQRAGDRRDRSVEGKLAQHAEALDRVAGDGADGRHQSKRDGKIVMAALLGKIGGREIDGDALGRQPEPDRV